MDSWGMAQTVHLDMLKCEKWKKMNPEKMIQPNPKFQIEHERKGTEEVQKREDDKRNEYVYESGFKMLLLVAEEQEARYIKKHVIGPFPMLEAVYRYLKEERHLVNLVSIKGAGDTTIRQPERTLCVARAIGRCRSWCIPRPTTTLRYLRFWLQMERA